MRSLGLGCIALIMVSALGCTSPEKHLARGDGYFLQGHYSLALHEYQASQRKDPTLDLDQKIRDSQVYLLLDEGDRAVDAFRWTEAGRAFEQVRRIDPESAELEWRLQGLVTARANWHFRRGQELIREDNPHDAVLEFEEALAHSPQHARAPEALVRAEEMKRDREMRAQAAYEQGRRARLAGRYEESIRHLLHAIELFPYYAEARLELDEAEQGLANELIGNADRAAERGDWSSALADYQMASRYCPDAPGLGHRLRLAEREVETERWVESGDRARESGDWRLAYQSYEQARCLSVAPERFLDRLDHVRTELASELFDAGQLAEDEHRYEDALLAYREVTELDSGHHGASEQIARLTARLDEAESYYDSGCVAMTERDLQAARRRFAGCEEVLPSYLDAHERLVEVDRDLALAESLYERASAAEAGSDLGRARLLFEECLSVTQPFREATSRLKDVSARLDMDSPEHFADACRAQSSRDYVRACELFEQCARTPDDPAGVAQRLAQVRGVLKQAGKLYKQAEKAERRGELDEAVDGYRACLGLSRPYQDAESRLSELRNVQKLLRTAARLDQRREFLAARDCYQQVLEQSERHPVAKQRRGELQKMTAALEADYSQMTAAEGSKDYRRALSLGLKIRDRCRGYRDVDARIAHLELEADYADGRSFEEAGQTELARRCYSRCSQRNPDFRDARERLQGRH